MDGMVGDHVAAPDLINAVSGYKVLQLDESCSLASPYHRSVVWEEPIQAATCLKHELFSWTSWGQKLANAQQGQHKSPHIDCKCGLYAYHDVRTFHEKYTPVYNGLCVVVLVACTGRMMVHQRGHRSERQEIRAISVDLSERFLPVNRLELRADAPRRLDSLQERAELWGVPFVEDFHELAHLAQDYDLQPVPTALLPDDSETSRP